MVQDELITIVDWYGVVYDLWNGAIFNDLEQPLTHIYKRELYSTFEYLRNDKR